MAVVQAEDTRVRSRLSDLGLAVEEIEEALRRAEVGRGQPTV